MINFTKKKLGDLGDIITGRTPKTGDPENFGREYMFLGPTDLHKKFVVNKSEKYITDKGLASINSSVIDGLSICVSCIGEVGDVALVNEKCATNQQINTITNIKDDYNPYFIYYWLKDKKEFLSKQANITITPILNKTDFSNIDIWLPSKSEQDKIANILSIIDEKIEVNNKISANLEAMAKQIYDYWFVQFDFPDKNGNPYKSSGGKMFYNEDLKRDIPERWRVKELGKIEPNIVTGKTPSTTHPENFGGEVPFICIGDVRGNMHITKTKQTLSKLGADSQLKKYVPKGAICVTCIASPGLVGFTTEDSQTNQQLNTIICNDFNNRYFLYFYLKDYFRFAKAKSGNTFANMNKDDFSSIKVIQAKEETLKHFSNTLNSSFNKILINSKQNNMLEDLRDWLLPMLMNGQIKI